MITSPEITPPAKATLGARILKFPLTRLILALLFLIIPFALLTILLEKFLVDKAARTAMNLVIAAVSLGAYYAYVRLIEKRPVSELSRTGAVQEAAWGFLIGCLIFSISIGILALLGIYRVTGINSSWLLVLAPLAGFIKGGVIEELVTRAVIFRLAENSLGSWLALLISALFFGGMHLANPGATLLAGAAIAVEAGIMLAAAYMLTRRLWLCIGIHVAWNFTQGAIFSVAVSGFQQKGLLEAQMSGPEWLSGGSFGAEASLVAVLVCTTLGVLLLLRAKQKGQFILPFWNRKN